jgi:phosphoribosylglycinamide formyltransferase-1
MILTEFRVNLLTDLQDSRFAAMPVHEALEALDGRGIHVQRYVRTPEQYLSWIDSEFGGSWSSEAYVGGSYIATDAHGPIGFAAFDPRGLRFRWLRAWSDRDDVGIFGPFGLTKRARKTGLGPVLLQGALFSLRERGYTQALIPAVQSGELIAYYQRNAGARVVEDLPLHPAGRAYRTVVLASGNGSNFQAVIDAAHEGRVPLDLVSLIANRGDAYAVQRAHAAGIPATTLVWDRATSSRPDYDAAVIDAVAQAKPDLVLLLGWMHVLPRTFVENFPQTLNLHPAFLPLDPQLDTVTMPGGYVIPAFRGKHAIDDAVAYESPWFGASVHRLRLEVDRGEIMTRAPLLRGRDEPVDALIERIHTLEHQVLVAALRRWTFEQP